MTTTTCACPTGAQLLNDSSCGCEGNSTFNPFDGSGTVGSCLPNCGISNCISCIAENNTCTVCKTNYTVVNNTCQLACNITNCAICSTPDTCSACKTNFTLDVNSSPVCVSNCGLPFCLTCNASTQVYLTCEMNYTISNASTCLPMCNVSGCDVCSGVNICSNCSTNFTLMMGSNSSAPTCVPNCGI